MKKLLAELLIVAGLLTASVVHAEVRNYTGVGEYYMSDFETPNVAQQRAKQRAEQNACEQAGVYVKSFSQAKNFELVEDVIITMTSGNLKVVDVQYHRENFDNNTTLIRATVKANINSDDVLSWLQKSKSEIDELVRQNEELRRAIAEQDRQIAELKQQLANMTTQQNSEQITKQFAAEDKIFLSNQKVSEGWQIYNRRDYVGAVKIFSEAVELNPENPLAYYGRAYAYNDLKNYQKAIEDCTKAVQFNSPRLVDAYNNRGEAYRHLERYDAAIADYNKALELNPSYFRAYNNRAIVYVRLSNYEQAFADYDKAIALKPDYALAYYNRGYAHLRQKNYEAAIADFARAIELDPNDTDAYNNRGWAYYCLKKYQQAIQDFNKAIEINPNYTLAKNNRDACYKALGK